MAEAVRHRSDRTPGPAGEIRPVAAVEPAEPSSNALTMFYLLNCESEDEAVRLAGRYPGSTTATSRCVRDGGVGLAPSIDTAATPAQVWSVYEDVDSWTLVSGGD